MKTKLTLSVEQDLVDFAHQQAKRREQSISDMVSGFLRKQQQQSQATKIPTLDDMVGSLKGYDIDYSKEGIRAAYAEKYLNRH